MALTKIRLSADSLSNNHLLITYYKPTIYYINYLDARLYSFMASWIRIFSSSFSFGVSGLTLQMYLSTTFLALLMMIFRFAIVFLYV